MNPSALDLDWSQCGPDRHRFRLRVNPGSSTEFIAGEADFHDNLLNALVDHVQQKRVGTPQAGLYLEVWASRTAGWRHLQNPSTRSVVAVTHAITGRHANCVALFRWACDLIQVTHDMERIANKLARAAVSVEHHTPPVPS